MENLLQRVLLLPKVIQDLIYEYNVDHRKMIYFVQRELIQKHVHIKTMKYVFIELENRNYRYGCINCKNCLIWIYDSDKFQDHIFGHPLCSDICRFYYICKISPPVKKYYTKSLKDWQI